MMPEMFVILPPHVVLEANYQFDQYKQYLAAERQQRRAMREAQKHQELMNRPVGVLTHIHIHIQASPARIT